MRRRTAPDDSLELLLDTICNTFGGVLFIAILVVLLLQVSPESNRQKEPVQESGVTDEVAALQSQEIELLERQIEFEKESRQSNEEVIDQLATAELRQLIKDKHAAEQEEIRLQKALEELAGRTDELKEKASLTQAEIESLQENAEELKELKQELEEQYDENRSERTLNIGLPKTRDAPLKQEIGLVLRYGRLYLWHEYDSNLRRSGLNEADFIVVSDKGGALFTRPDPTRGILLDGSEEMKNKIRNLLRRFKDHDLYPVLVVRPDSFGVFRHARDVIVSMGFEYRLIHVPDGLPVQDRGGRADFVQ